MKTFCRDNITIHAATDFANRTKGGNELAKAGCLPRGMSDFQNIIDFDHPAAALSFRYVNDTTMGGGSSCEIKYFNVENYSRFFGRLSFVRGGGFVSVRCPPLERGVLTGTHGLILLSSASDGRLYKVLLKTQAGDGCDASLWVADFFPSADSEGLWRVTKLPYENFTPIKQNQPWNPGGPLNPKFIVEIGLLQSRWKQDGTEDPGSKEGEFSLNIKNIRGYFASLSPLKSQILRDRSPQRSPLLSECMAFLDPPQDSESEFG